MSALSNEPEPKPVSDTQTTGKIMFVIAWLFIFFLGFLFFANWENQARNPNQKLKTTLAADGSRSIVIQRNRYNHYVMSGKINGKSVELMLDTGASNVVVPGSLQEYLGLTRGLQFQVQTANGDAAAYATELATLQIGDIVLHNVRASIAPSYDSEDVLLGMSVLKQFHIQQTGDQLIITQARNHE